MFIKKSDLHNFADDNTRSAFGRFLDPLIHILTEEFENAIVWLHNNNMIVNPGKFQVLFVNLLGKIYNTSNFSVESKQILFTSLATILDLQTYNKANFDSNISTLCK